MAESGTTPLRLVPAVDPGRDHVRGSVLPGSVSLVIYADYLCPYCRRLRPVLVQLREALGERLAYVFRHFPNERAHPGATLLARVTEAAGRQGRFWELHDWLYTQDPPPSGDAVLAYAASLGLDMERFAADLESEQVRSRVEEDLDQGRHNGVSGTPTVFIDGQRYDGAWDFHAMLEALERPVGARVQRSARAFASLPASGGLVLLLAAAAALVCTNTSLAPWYRLFVESELAVGPPRHALTMTVGEWSSEALLAIFFLLVGLEIRREFTAGSLSDRRSAVLPVVAAFGGVVTPAAVYLLLNHGASSTGWSIPTATDVAFTLGVLALFGSRIPSALRVSVAALAVVDDVISVVTLAVFYSHGFAPRLIAASVATTGVLFALNRSRVYRAWPYAVATVALAVFLHAAGIHAALAGVVLAVFLPTRPAPAAGPLLAQAATALASLEDAERDGEERERAGIKEDPIWDWATRNLAAATDRLLSPAERIERAVAPWTAYLILPLFAFSATGVDLSVDVWEPRTRTILLGVTLGLALGKPAGILLAGSLAVKAGVAVPPPGVNRGSFVGAACLCGLGYTMSLLMADRALGDPGQSAIAKIGILAGSTLAALVGTAILLRSTRQSGARTPRQEG